MEHFLGWLSACSFNFVVLGTHLKRSLNQNAVLSASKQKQILKKFFDITSHVSIPHSKRGHNALVFSAVINMIITLEIKKNCTINQILTITFLYNNNCFMVL